MNRSSVKNSVISIKVNMKRGELLSPRKTSHVRVKLCKKLIYLSVVHKIITVYTIDNKNFSLKKITKTKKNN